MISPEAKKKAAEAKRQRLWLYDPIYKKWYSPEDFEHIFSYANADENFLNRIQVKHPVEELEAGFKRLYDLHCKLQSFALSVTEYYTKKH